MVVSETVSDPNVVRRTLMGGTLACAEPGSDVVDTLLGPERTDVLSRQKTTRLIFSHTAENFLGLVLGKRSGLCVV